MDDLESDNRRLVSFAESVGKRLIENMGLPERRPWRAPLDELILTVLSQNTTDVNSLAAFKSLKNRFPSWELLFSAQYEEVLETIRPAGLGPTKTRRILDLMPIIRREDPTLTLDFLSSNSIDEGYEFLTGISGVGRKTAACVLLFACGKPAFPVDTHVFRVSRRIGLDTHSRTRDQMQALFERIVPAEDRYNLHMNLIRLGRNICRARSPKCPDCFLTDLCAYYSRLNLPGMSRGLTPV